MTDAFRPASPSSDVRLSTSSRLAATSSTFICSPSASGSRIWKSSSTLAMSNGTCCSASQRITSREAEQHVPFDMANVELDFRSEEHTSELQSRLHLVCRL